MTSLQIPCTGYSIAADWYDGQEPNKILLALPGYTSTKARQASFIEAMVEQTGMPTLVIDYSGHGESPFELAETRPAQHFLEVICAFDWLRARYPEAEISVTGTSYGGFLATQLTKYRRFKDLVLRAPAIYRPDEFYNLWAVRLNDEAGYRKAMLEYRSNAEELAGHPLLARASRFAGRTLVVVHENDELVPRQTTDAYIQSFHADSFIAEGFNHAISQTDFTSSQLWDYQIRIANWLNAD